MKAEKEIIYHVTLSESEYKDVQTVLQEKGNNSTATPSQIQLLNEISQNL